MDATEKIGIKVAKMKAASNGDRYMGIPTVTMSRIEELQKKAREEGKEKVILMNYSGHGLMDLTGYDAFMSGKLTDYELPQEELEKFTKPLENLPAAEMRKSGKW